MYITLCNVLKKPSTNFVCGHSCIAERRNKIVLSFSVSEADHGFYDPVYEHRICFLAAVLVAYYRCSLSFVLIIRHKRSSIIYFPPSNRRYVSGSRRLLAKQSKISSSRVTLTVSLHGILTQALVFILVYSVYARFCYTPLVRAAHIRLLASWSTWLFSQ